MSNEEAVFHFENGEGELSAYEAWLAEEEIATADHVASELDLDLYADDLLRRARGLLKDYLRNRDVYEWRKAELEAWYTEAQGPIERQLRWLEGLLVNVARLIKFPGRAKSRKLPNGKIGRRAVPARVEILDVEKAVAFCERHDLEIKKEPYKRPILAFLAERPRLVDQAVDFGIQYVPKNEEGVVYWQVPEHDLLKGKREEE